ncbi:MAG: Asp-tRNA(Asn)/Glu-tRNA(Gln) amidotransferase subunit GatB [Alphaproteobacteria bacterium]|nr:Asp-tRNA(Asn)/Glu-tRNA(Gln) amidotransferase subunit GatB [Alphaproteobacteria bacterium]
MNNLVSGKKDKWEIVIGLEIHAQVISNSKLFSGSSTKFGAEPNCQVSLLDASMPGMLPVINQKCLEQAVRTGLGLNAKINNISIFDRKNYFYPDLPQGYQISQYTKPIVGKGLIELDLPDGQSKKVGITRLHLEQDAGKSIHDMDPKQSFIDLNRAGIALMEIVSDPDIRSAEEAGLFVRKVRSILMYLGTCDGNMEQGSMRGDVNVSVRRPGEDLGTRCEIKNVNSIRYIQQAIDFESRRQIELLESGKKIIQETRLFDASNGETRTMRSKEEAHDYRYFPDPDLLPLKISDDFIKKIKANLPELPDAKKERFINDYGLSSYDAGVLVSEKAIADYFEKAAKGRDSKIIANWVIGDLFALLNKTNKTIEDPPILPESLGELIDFIQDGTISGRIAKEVFESMAVSGKAAAAIIEEKGLKQVSDVKELTKVIKQGLSDRPNELSEYKNGKEKVFGFFVGQVMKLTAGKANPAKVNEILKKELSN